jgi:hypothetical protein
LGVVLPIFHSGKIALEEGDRRRVESNPLDFDGSNAEGAMGAIASSSHAFWIAKSGKFAPRNILKDLNSDILPTLNQRLQRGLPNLTIGYSGPAPLI